jgi:hypothetical protein
LRAWVAARVLVHLLTCFNCDNKKINPCNVTPPIDKSNPIGVTALAGPVSGHASGTASRLHGQNGSDESPGFPKPAPETSPGYSGDG